MVKYIKGGKLSKTAQGEALAAYCHRYTMEHVPTWARKPAPNGKYYKPHFASDAEWLANSEFPVTKRGRLSRHEDADCRSWATWPLGQGFADEPFKR